MDPWIATRDDIINCCMVCKLLGSVYRDLGRKDYPCRSVYTLDTGCIMRIRSDMIREAEPLYIKLGSKISFRGG